MKKQYKNPQTESSELNVMFNLLAPSAPEEGIHNGGEGDDEDDPTSKSRPSTGTGNSWGDLW